MAADKGGTTKIEGEEGSTSTLATLIDQGDPASERTDHMEHVAESTCYAEATATFLVYQFPKPLKRERAPLQPYQRDGAKPTVDGSAWLPESAPSSPERGMGASLLGTARERTTLSDCKSPSPSP